MPNHITNKLIISGELHLIEQIIGPDTDIEHEDYQLDFKRVVPYPPGTDIDEFDWYNWHCNNWGTKWNAYETLISYDNDTVELTFQTAWSPPNIWFERTVELFPSLEFKLSWVDEDYPSSGLFKGSNGIHTRKDFISDNEAKEFIKEEWPELYEMYENDRAIDNLETELNEYIHEFYPNTNIKISDYESNDEDINEPTKLAITYIDSINDSDIWLTLDKTLQKNIIKKVKEILLEHGYKTKIRGQQITVIKI